MNILLIIVSLLIGYVIFMMSFYLLAKVIFQKIELTEEEEYLYAREALEAKRMKEIRNTKRDKALRFGKEPQAA